MDLAILALLPVVLIVSFPSGEALHCFVCNSGEIYEKKACADITKDSTQFLENCTAIGLTDNHDYKRCRVMVQDVEGDVRVVRSCATWPDETKTSRCVDRTGTNKIKVRYCECEGDKCNESSRISSSVFILLAAAIGAVSASFLSR